MRAEMETERMLLRPLSAGDAGLLYELDSDPEVMRYLSGGPPTPLQAIETRILPGMLAIAAAGDGHGAWAAMDRASGAFVGWFMLRPGNDGVSSEAGYRLLRRWWGRGLATEGLDALLHRAFAEMGRERVFGTTYEENHASRRVMEKAGMVPPGRGATRGGHHVRTAGHGALARRGCGVRDQAPGVAAKSLTVQPFISKLSP